MQKLNIPHNSITKELDTGTHEIEYELAGYSTIEFNITVVGGQDKTYHKTMTAAKPKFTTFGYVMVSPTAGKPGDIINVPISIRNNGNLAAPADVRGSLDGVMLPAKTTPSIAIGATITYKYAFSVPDTSAGKKALKIEVLYDDVVHITKDLFFTVVKATALITFDTTPKGAKVYVDGTYIGIT